MPIMHTTTLFDRVSDMTESMLRHYRPTDWHVQLSLVLSRHVDRLTRFVDMADREPSNPQAANLLERRTTTEQRWVDMYTADLAVLEQYLTSCYDYRLSEYANRRDMSDDAISDLLHDAIRMSFRRRGARSLMPRCGKCAAPTGMPCIAVSGRPMIAHVHRGEVASR